jgi:cytochrome P450
MLTFAEQPEKWQELRAHPELLQPAIEESLRFRSPVQAMFRVTTTKVELHGQVIPAGAPVVAWIGSANHDEGQFPEPEQFDTNRSPNRHIAFGQGIHFCLGAPLARLEAKIALSAMVERFDSFALETGARINRQPSLIVYGVDCLPITFTRS